MKPTNYPSSPEKLWDIFYDFTQIPRPSKKEQMLVGYLINLARKKSLKHVTDTAGNVIIYVPGRNGRENDPPILVQNHIDMVTDALHNIDIDFSKDPIKTKVEGDWLTAVGTTLGADNGIGCAASLATIFDDTLVHPPLELLFTVDEETGLNGALGLDETLLKSKKMLNLDTEEWGSLYIGCAGGIDYELTKELDLVSSELTDHKIKIQIDNFIGGHSGLDIHEQRGNALKFLAEYLDLLRDTIQFELVEIRGGKAHNIIPRDCFAIINTNEVGLELFKKIGKQLSREWSSYLPKNDLDFRLSFQSIEMSMSKVLNRFDRDQIIDYLNLFPHGAHRYDVEVKELVSMSNNFAKFLLVNGKVYTQSSLRFFDRDEVKSLEKKIRLLGKNFKMKVCRISEYPSWRPTLKNPILELVKESYYKLFSEQPNVTAIHAGLECGIIRDKIGDIDVVSFGPTITGAHSPDEKVHIPSVEKFWNLYKEVLTKI